MKSKKNKSIMGWIVFGMCGSLILGIFLGVLTNISSNQMTIGYRASYTGYNISDLNYDNIGLFCKELTPKNYELSVWWDGCTDTRNLIKFTCGYQNEDGAKLFKCHTLEELNNYLIKERR